MTTQTDGKCKCTALVRRLGKEQFEKGKLAGLQERKACGGHEKCVLPLCVQCNLMKDAGREEAIKQNIATHGFCFKHDDALLYCRKCVKELEKQVAVKQHIEQEIHNDAYREGFEKGRESIAGECSIDSYERQIIQCKNENTRLKKALEAK